MLAAGLGGWVAGFGTPAVVLLSLLLKFIAELLLVLRAGSLFGNYSGILLSPLVSLGMIPYLIVFGIRGMSGAITWKN